MNALRLWCLSVVVGGVVGCGLLNGLTEGDVRSPFAPPRDLPAGSPCRNIGDCRYGVGFECTGGGQNFDQPAEGVCACVVGDECPTDEACRTACPTCLAAGPQECFFETALVGPPVVTDACEPASVSVRRRDGGDDQVGVDVFIPQTWIDTPFEDRHLVVLLHNSFGRPSDWRGPAFDLPCELFNRDISVWSVARSDDTSGSYLELLLLGIKEHFVVLPAQISVVAGSTAVGELHSLIADGTSLRSAAFLSGGADFAPTPAAVASAVASYPEDALWMAAADDGACGPTLSCFDYLDQMRAVFEGERSWTFHDLVGEDHGAALISNGADDGAGNTASSILLQMLEP